MILVRFFTTALFVELSFLNKNRTQPWASPDCSVSFCLFVLYSGQPGLALILSIPAGFLVAALAGVVIERTVIQYLKGRPLETLLATFGVSLILQQLVRTVVSPLNRTVITPEWMSGSVMINEALSLTLNRLYVIGFALVMIILFIQKRPRGLFPQKGRAAEG